MSTTRGRSKNTPDPGWFGVDTFVYTLANLTPHYSSSGVRWGGGHGDRRRVSPSPRLAGVVRLQFPDLAAACDPDARRTQRGARLAGYTDHNEAASDSQRTGVCRIRDFLRVVTIAPMRGESPEPERPLT